MTMTMEERPKATDRRELKRRAKGMTSQQKGGEKKAIVVTTSKSELEQMLLQSETAEEFVEWRNTYPDILTDGEYEGILREWQMRLVGAEAVDTISAVPVVEVPAEIEDTSAVFTTAWGAVVAIEPPQDVEIQTSASDESPSLPPVEVAEVLVEMVDILADSAKAAKQAEIVIRERSRGWTYDASRDGKEKQKRRKLRRPKRWKKEMEGEVEDLPDELKFKPSEELVQLGLFLEAAGEVLNERWQEAKMFRQLSRRVVIAITRFKEAYEFHLELRKEFRELDARERTEWRERIAAQNGRTRKEKMDWGDERRTKKQVIAQKRLLATLGPTPNKAASVRYVL